MKTKFVLSINCNNDSFQPDPRAEVSRLLRDCAERLDAGETADFYRNLKDENGNIVGSFKLIRQEE